MKIKIRKARLSDLQAVTDIYNQVILSSTATFDTEPKTIEERRKWFTSRGRRFPVLVGEIDGEVVGWGALSPISERGAYFKTAEVSVYVKEGFRHKGVGKSILKELIEFARKADFHTLIAQVVRGNEVSIHLLESFGFKKVGTLKEVGYKFEKYLDVEVLQLIFD
jgi:phosphinothricin acetyltransferase